MKYLFSSYVPVIYPFSYYLSCKVDTIQTRQFFSFSHLIRYLGRFELFFFPRRIFYLSGITLLNNVSELPEACQKKKGKEKLFGESSQTWCFEINDAIWMKIIKGIHLKNYRWRDSSFVERTEPSCQINIQRYEILRINISPILIYLLHKFVRFHFIKLSTMKNLLLKNHLL